MKSTTSGIRARSSATPSKTTTGSLLAAMLLVVSALAVAPPVAAEPEPEPSEEPSDAVVVDDFGRADSVGLGSAPTGQVWSVWSGSAGVVGGAAGATGSGYTLGVLDSGTADSTVSMSVPVAGAESWLVVRASDSGNYWRFGRFGGDSYSLQQIRGWWFGPAEVVSHASVLAGDGDRLSCELGSSISCSVNGVLVASSDDSFNESSTFVGFATGAAVGSRFDDLLVGDGDPVVDPGVDLGVGVVADAGSVVVGSPVSFTASVVNGSSVGASGVVFSGDVPAGLADVSVSSTAGSCVVDGAVSCDLGVLDPAGSATVTVSGVASEAGQQLVFTGSVSFDGVDVEPLNDTASASVSVTSSEEPSDAVVVDDFGRADSVGLGSAPTGQVWSVWSGSAGVVGGAAGATGSGYTLGVLDSGTADATVSMSVPVLSEEFWLITRGSDAGNYWRFGRIDGGTYVLEQIRGWSIANVAIDQHLERLPAAGDRLECRLAKGVSCFVNDELVVSSRDGYNDQASYVGFATSGPTVPTVRFDDLEVREAVSASDLTVDLSGMESSVDVGEPLSWSATVSNQATQTAEAVEISVEIPLGFTDVTISSDQGSCQIDGGNYSCEVGDIEPESVVELEFTATAPQATGRYGLSVAAQGVAPDGDESDNRARVTVSVRQPAAPGEKTTDSFDRADAPELGLTDQGRPWEVLTGSIGIRGDAAANVDPDGRFSMATVDPGFTFGTMSVRVTEGAEDGFYLVFRARDADNYYRVGPDWSGNYRVEKIRDGRVSPLQFSSVRQNVEAADGDLLRLVLRPDDSWFLSVNGVHVLDGGDTDQMFEFRYGMATSNPDVRFDDLEIDPFISSGIHTLENFDDPDGTNLELSTATSGTQYPWLTPRGYWSSSNGTAVLQTPGFGLAMMELSSQLADVSVTSRADDTDAWLIFRMSHDGSHYRFGHYAGQPYTVEFVGVDGSVEPLPAPVTIDAVAFAAPDDRLAVAQLADGTIEAYVNGQLVASSVDSDTNFPESWYGMAGTSGVTFDDFEVTPK